MSKMNVTVWRPDTCDCEIAYEWDEDLPADQRVHTPVASWRSIDGTTTDNNGRVSIIWGTHTTLPCVHHAAKHSEHGHVGLHSIVLAENQMKNGVLRHLQNAKPSAAIHEVPWKFDSSHHVHVDLSGHPKAASAVEAGVATEFSNAHIHRTADSFNRIISRSEKK